MSRLLVILAAFVVIIVVALFLLAGNSHEKPLAPVEKVVPLATLQR